MCSPTQGDTKEGKAIIAEVVAISTEASMPCAHTSMVAFETTAAQLQKHGDPADNTVGVKKRHNKAAIAALAVGGTVCVVGASMAAAGAFGSVAGTMAGLSAFGDMGGGLFDGGADFGGVDGGGDGDCCDCCDDGCDCDCDCDCTIM